MLLNPLSSTRFAPPQSTRTTQPSLAPAHQQRSGVQVAPELQEKMGTILEKASRWASVEATDRLRERSQRIKASHQENLSTPDEKIRQFLEKLNRELPVINVPAEVEKLNSVWQAFMGGNNHFSLSDIRHVTRNYGRENEAYELRICLDLAKLPQGASENVQNIARQIIEAQSKAIKEGKEYTQLHLEGLNALQFTHIPQLQIEDNKISFDTTFSPTSHFSTKQHFNYATQIMAVLNKALED